MLCITDKKRYKNYGCSSRVVLLRMVDADGADKEINHGKTRKSTEFGECVQQSCGFTPVVCFIVE